MLNHFFGTITTFIFLYLNVGDGFAGINGPDKDNNASFSKSSYKAAKKKQATNIITAFENKGHLNLTIQKQETPLNRKSPSLESSFCELMRSYKFSHITALNLAMETDLTTKMVACIVQFMPKISNLHLKGFFKVDDSELLTLSRKFPNIAIQDETDDFVYCYPTYSDQRKPVSWISLQPAIEETMRKSIANPQFIERSFYLDVHRDDFACFHSWLSKFQSQFKYPIGVMCKNNGVEGDKVDNKYEVYHIQIDTYNYTMKEESSRKTNEYKFFEGKLNPDLVNEGTFYNLMALVGFTKENFENGATGLQGRIAVKPIQIKSKTLVDFKREIKEEIRQNLSRSKEVYVTFVFNLPPDAQYTLDKGTQIIRTFGYDNLRTICEKSENRLYLCFLNNQRKILDLHGFDKEGEFNGITEDSGLELVCNYVYEAYYDFRTECTVLTGRGNHANENGTRGILAAAFPKWMEDELIKPYVKSFFPMSGEGGFKVILNKPHICDLIKSNLANSPLELVATKLRKIIDLNEDRLLILTTDNDLDRKLIHFLAVNGHRFIGSTLSYRLKSVPGQLKITLEKGRVVPPKQQVKSTQAKKSSTSTKPQALQKHENNEQSRTPLQPQKQQPKVRVAHPKQ